MTKRKRKQRAYDSVYTLTWAMLGSRSTSAKWRRRRSKKAQRMVDSIKNLDGIRTEKQKGMK